MGVLVAHVDDKVTKTVINLRVLFNKSAFHSSQVIYAWGSERSNPALSQKPSGPSLPRNNKIKIEPESIQTLKTGNTETEGHKQPMQPRDPPPINPPGVCNGQGRKKAAGEG